MARIKTIRTPRDTRVTVIGKLTAADMGRLEHACAGALTSVRPRLDIDLTQVTYADDTAIAILQHLADRGATVRGGTLAV